MRFIRLLTVIVIAAAQAGCVGFPFPELAIARAPPPPPPADLDSILYGRPAAVLPDEAAPLPVPAALLPGPAPGGDEPYTLDSGDKLRVVVFGQDGLSNTYIVDASGKITIPLIGPVSARLLHDHPACAHHCGSAAQRLCARAPRCDRGRDATGRSSSWARSSPRAISLRAEHDGGDCGGDRGRVYAARLPLRFVVSRSSDGRDGTAKGAADRAGTTGRHRHRERALVLILLEPISSCASRGSP